MVECDGGQYVLAGSILVSFVATIGAILKICASKGMYCESNCSGSPCICDTNEGRPPHSSNRPRQVIEPTLIEEGRECSKEDCDVSALCIEMSKEAQK